MKTTNIVISIEYLDDEDAENKKADIIEFLRNNPVLFKKKDWEIYNELNSHFDFFKGVSYKIDDPNNIFGDYFGGLGLDIWDFQESSVFLETVLEIISQERKKWNEKNLE